MFFPKDLLSDDRVIYTNAKGRETYKQVVGHSKVLNAYWHLGMRAVVRLDDFPSVRCAPMSCSRATEGAHWMTRTR